MLRVRPYVSELLGPVCRLKFPGRKVSLSHCISSVIINDFDIKNIIVAPHEAHTPLVVHAVGLLLAIYLLGDSVLFVAIALLFLSFHRQSEYPNWAEE